MEIEMTKDRMTFNNLRMYADQIGVEIKVCFTADNTLLLSYGDISDA